MSIKKEKKSIQKEILIVEDSLTQSEQLKYILEKNDYKVLVAYNGKEALACVENNQPIIVISDIVMPGMDGYELCRKIKDNQKLKDIAVILLTTLSDSTDILHGLECGADNFMTKPYDEDFLLTRIQNIYANHELRKKGQAEMGVEINFAGKRQFINSERFQIIDLLLSTYDLAVKKNLELIKVQEELKNLNQLLEAKVDERTTALQEEIIQRKQIEEKIKVLAKFPAEDPSPVLRVSKDGTILYANKAGQTLLDDWKCVIGSRAPNHWYGLISETFMRKSRRAIEIKMGKQTYLFVICPILDEGYVNFYGSDITERVRAEEDKLKLQGQLAQAQKIESVGLLAGGVAHDFNNMLQTILGYTEMGLKEIDPDNPLKESLLEIQKAGLRSSELTRQLLAFARKQTISPIVLNINDVITGMLKMLTRLINENIKIIFKPCTVIPWPVKMDPSQIDQILVNLTVNARDAITGVGEISIETNNVNLDESYCSIHSGFMPGRYFQLTVSDNGCGMDETTMTHVFEPFFTTKGMGQGTGLGLSTVYGIIKQNNGFINVYSEPGKGTTFRLYFLAQKEESIITNEPIKQIEPPIGTETVLLVEDNLSLLQLAKQMLVKLGYTVIASSSPKKAIQLTQEYTGTIHLLMTDVVMPEMSGRDLWSQINQLRADSKCLYMSGYTANVIVHQGILDEGINFIQKPFSMEALALKIREVLSKQK